jgi:hypothetical protein
LARHSSSPIGTELPTSTTTRGGTSASKVDVSLFVHRPVEALDQFSDRIV